MFGLRLGFEHPGYLALLILIPVFWLASYRGLALLGPVRRTFALLLRTLVAAAIVLALAGVQLVWTDDRMTVMYLLDQSESIPVAKRDAMLQYVIRNVAAQRNTARADRAGIIVFGKEAAVEIPPFDDDIPDLRRLESYLGRKDATNLEAALKLAQAAMPDDTSRRIVVVTDGNENLGNASQLASRIARAGIGIDVVPVQLDATSEVLVEKIDLPPDIRRGQPFEARVVINNYSPGGESKKPIPGRLEVTRKLGSDEQVLLNEPITLDPDKPTVFPLRHTIDQPAPYTYKARFVPDDPASDAVSQNNEASAYTYVRGKGRVLLIEDWARPDEYREMIETLRKADIEIVVMPSNNLFTSMAELQAYDAVIIAGVPRTSGEDADSISGFDDDHIEMLVRNTQQLGCGLLMLGGPDAFGAGGWAGTKLEEAMPVDFQIRNTKVQAIGALAMIMHASEMAQGNHWQKVVARSAIEALGPADYCGIIHWAAGGDQWLWGGRTGLLPVGSGNRRSMLAAVSRMTPGDMPQFDPAMQMTLAALNANQAALKHCIIISDGDPSPAAGGTIRGFANAGIKISTVAVASHGTIGSNRLRDIAKDTGGKYYEAKSPKALPKIYQREARRVSRPLVYEPPGGATPQISQRHPVLEGIDAPLPPISGFVLTEIKQSPLAQVLIRSPMPEQPDNQTILAAWTYGLGRAAVMTTDTGKRWATDWPEWDGYDKFYSQLVRWIMRPSGDTGKFTMATKVEDGRVRVVVEALDKEDDFLNFLDMNASAIGPDLSPLPLQMRQVAPGRYVGEFAADESGSYFLNVVPAAGEAPLSQGVTVPYSNEFRVRTVNEALLKALADTEPNGGEAGQLTEPLEKSSIGALTDHATFRGGLAHARSIRDVWPLFVLAGCCIFLGDVFIRRVAIDFSWIGRLLASRRGQASDAENSQTERMAALRSRKLEINEELDRRRSATRFEPRGDPTPGGSTSAAATTSTNRPSAGTPASMEPQKEEKSYTERLLEAKRAARRKSDES
ncbi:von Willebrand factor type A domain protein [Rosistilla ulvae]|uniref:von Willebrand factor type A domain protein n=1 Tax=Rosistilla ulvae TaxID=1930277 RepID=A0A517LYW9_9BACT|nr:VWA domain-containing protein [Rosistilla ulvae]QDS87823.1 von Willebrand factor type A domain protein [Rosistilla ulvae]